MDSEPLSAAVLPEGSSGLSPLHLSRNGEWGAFHPTLQTLSHGVSPCHPLGFGGHAHQGTQLMYQTSRQASSHQPHDVLLVFRVM